MLSEQLRNRLTRHFGTADLQVELIEQPGFSGLPIYRVQCVGKQFALRAWPNSPSSRMKVEHWDQVVLHLSSSTLNRSLFPKIEKWRGDIQLPLFQTMDDMHWTLASWMDGSPLLSERISEPIRIQLSERLANLHRETATVHSCVGRSFAIQERLDGLKSIAKTSLNPTTSDPVQWNVLAKILQAQKELPLWEKFLRQESRRDRMQHWIVRDLWRDNLLVDDNCQLLSIVDLGASRIEWPVFDFVRLIGSLKSSMTSWSNAYDAYQSGQPSSTLPELAVCLMLHRISTAIAIAYWNDQLHTVAHPSLQRDRIFARMSELLDIWDSCDLG
jgi:Ser/Thr protein kinase RdoA (MazF antagonist)